MWPGTDDNSDPFADDDPLAELAPDDEFDALGFDTGFSLDQDTVADEDVPPPAMSIDNDDTPPVGIYVGEAIQVLDASTIGRALAEAEGHTQEELPDMAALQSGLVGIDIGAAVAVVARFNDDGQHELVPNQETNDLHTPVQIFFDDDGEQLVGREARQMAPSAPSRVVVDLKAAISSPDFKIAGEAEGDLSAEDVLTIFLRRLMSDVEVRASQPATHVALAAPAWFDEAQREKLRQAARNVGVELVGITDEALAAAVPYSLRLPDLNRRKAAVFDLGHAALGVAIVQCASGDIKVLAQKASRALGSARWDQLLAEECARKFKQAHGFDPLGDEGAALDLRLRAEDAKQALSERARCTVVVSCNGKTLKVGFTRKGFEHAAQPLVDGSLGLLEEVREAAGVASWDELDALIMTGGGSRTPSVRRAVAKQTGREPERGISPEECVAIGALYWGIGERHQLSKSEG